MAYIADLDPNNLDHARAEARAEFFDSEFPNWEVRENFGISVLSESDFPVYDDTADRDRVPNEDWERMGG